MSIHVATFYRFVAIEDPAQLRLFLQDIQAQNSVLGLVYTAHEGINGTVAGSKAQIEAWFNGLSADQRFVDLTYRSSFSEDMPFTSFRVRVKKNIVSIGIEDLDVLKHRGQDVDPQDWNALIAQPDIQVIDMRKDLEFELGTFEGAVNMEADCFREFPKWAAEHLSPDQRIAMFCTGGIRCEKASAYLRQQGFQEVYQLKGGILQYFADVELEAQLWKGNCFVFDERGAVDGRRQPVQAELCYACSYPIRESDISHAHYLKNGHCPRCYGRWTEPQLQRFRSHALACSGQDLPIAQNGAKRD